MKARAKEALSINLHSEKYIRILQILETQLKRNRKGNSPFYYSPSRLSSMTLPYGYDSHHLPVLHTSRTWPCDPAPPPYFTPAHHSPNPEPRTNFLLLWIQSRNTWQCVLASAIWLSSSSVSVSWLSPVVMGSLVTDRLLIYRLGVILV